MGNFEGVCQDAAVRTSRVLKALLRFALGAALATATVELVARRYAFMPEAGNAKVWHREGDAVSHWRKGVRLPISKSGPRILVIGDSYTAAQHVPDDQTFVYVAERELGRAGRDVTLLNVGVPGTSVVDHILDGPGLVERQQANWSLVVLTDDDLGESAWARGGSHFELVGGELATRRPPVRHAKKDLLRPIRNNSALLQNAFLQYRGLLDMAAAWHPFHANPPRPRAAAADPSYPVAAELRLVYDSFAGRVTFVHLGISTPSPVETEFRAACATEHWHCITTREQLERLRASGVPPQGFPNSGWDKGHLNAWGHRVVGETIAAGLRNAVF